MSTTTTELTIHKEFDARFDSLCEYMEDGFSADNLDTTDWTARFQALPAILSAFNPSLVRESSIMKYLHEKLFFAEHAQDWIIPAHAAKYVHLFSEALNAGFILDCVTDSGPTPKLPWEAKVTSPVKKAPPKKSLPPSPYMGPSPSPAIPFVQPPAPQDPAVQVLAVQVPASQVPVHVPAVHVPVAQVTVPPAPAFPPGISLDDALVSFLAGGGGSSLPASSSNPGTSSTSLPILASGANSCHSFIPGNQAIYELGKYLRSYSPEEAADSFTLDASGNLVVKKSVRKISSAVEWNEAILNFGVALSESPSETKTFSWAAFTVYISRVAVYFRLYSFSSVMAFDIAFRKWRRAHDLPWDASNELIKDLILTRSVPPTAVPTSKPVRDNSCGDFQNGKCKRPSCLYPHRCRRCNTTFAPSFRACPCVAGALPPGVTLPVGVTFGV